MTFLASTSMTVGPTMSRIKLRWTPWAAVRRFLPQLRGSTTTAKLYLRKLAQNPRCPEAMQAMVAAACIVRDWSVAGAMLVGFPSVLRTSEILNLTSSHIRCFPGSRCHRLSFKASRSALRSGVAECVLTPGPTRCFNFRLGASGTRASNSMPSWLSNSTRGASGGVRSW